MPTDNLGFLTTDFAFNVGTYALIAGLAVVLFWFAWQVRLAARRIQAPRPGALSRGRQLRREIGYSLGTLTIFTALDWVFFQLYQHGHTQLYEDVGAHGWLWLVLSFLLLFPIHDTYFYWTHRLMHHRWLFKRVHRIHHLSTDPSPLAAYAFHPLEAVVEYGVTFILPFVLPLHIVAVYVFQLVSLGFNVIGHLGYEIYPPGFDRHPLWRWKTPSLHHNLHHEKYNGNYALYFTWWDRMMGTEFKDYHERYARLWAGGR